MKKYELDATNQSLGRLASQTASILRGKNTAAFTPNKLAPHQVIVKNIKLAKFTGKKLNQKTYYHYSGYHSGIRARKLSELWETRPEYVFRKMTYAMLPKNRMRSEMIKNLKFN